MHTDQRLAVRLGHAGELAVQDDPGLCVGCREDVSIGVDRRLDARVAQAGLNHMDGHTGHQQMACVNIAGGRAVSQRGYLTPPRFS